jgi:hypothetical protein
VREEAPEELNAAKAVSLGLTPRASQQFLKASTPPTRYLLCFYSHGINIDMYKDKDKVISRWDKYLYYI